MVMMGKVMVIFLFLEMILKGLMNLIDFNMTIKI